MLLSLPDHLFLLLENPKQPMNAGGICIFEQPKDDDDFVDRLVAHLTQNPKNVRPPFNHIPQGLHWKKDPNFDLGRHFFRHRLQENTQKALLDYIAHHHRTLMDRKKPLWEFHVIENISATSTKKSFALYFKIHHALSDGVGAMHLLRRSLHSQPTPDFAPPLWATQSSKTSHTKAPKAKQKKLFLLKDSLSVLKALQQRFADRQLPQFTSVFDAPKTPLNQTISGERQIFVRSFDKPSFERIAHNFGVSTNDAILAVCAGALRRYLIQKDALPTKPLIAFVPISLRQDASGGGNRLSFLLANLATDKSCATTRLQHIHASTQDAKQRFLGMNYAQIMAYSLATYGAFGLNLMTALSPTNQAFNLIISNIPGGSEALYLGEAALTELYPASVLFDGQALNITFANYAKKIDIGLTVCPKTLTDSNKLLGYMQDELLQISNTIANHQ